MARTRLQASPLNLNTYDVLIEDRGARSDYFRLSQFDGYLSGGRNAFLIAGSTILKPGSNIYVEILDKNGSPVYSAIQKAFAEGGSRLVRSEVYEDTEIGSGKIIILGCITKNLDGSPIPDEWKDKINVRWVTDVTISPKIENTTPIRFLRTPVLTAEEKFYYNPESSSFTINTSSLDLSLEAKYYNLFPNGYTVNIKGPTTASSFENDQINGVITGSIKILTSDGPETASINLPITKIYNLDTADVDGSIIQTDKGTILTKLIISGSQPTSSYTTIISPIGTADITSSLYIEYNKVDTISTASVVSFADLRLSDLETISGEIHKVRFSYKSSTDPGEYKLLGEVPTTVTELFAVDSASSVINTGLFNSVPVNTYWYTATMSVDFPTKTKIPPNYYNTQSLVTTENLFTNSNYLLDSINTIVPLNGNTYASSSYFIGNKPNNLVTLFPRSEYTLSFDALVRKVSGSINLQQDYYNLEIYLVENSGSINGFSGRVLDQNKMGQLIGTVKPNQNFGAQNFDDVELNFVPNISVPGDFGIRFVFYGGFWNVANVSLKAAEEPFFSADEIDALLPQIEYADKLLTFKAEFVDVNNNSTPIVAYSDPVYFTGSLAGGSGNITYISESGNFNLSEIKVNDYDGEVAVDFSSGRLTFTFGAPATPSALDVTLSGFDTDRFNNVNDPYNVNGTWNNGGYTLITASLYTGSTLLTEVYTGTSLSYPDTTSGSQQYRLEYTASSPLDASIYTNSDTVAGTLSKTNPTNPSISPSATVQLGATSNQIEQGATGSISFTANYGTANSWTQLALVTVPASSPITISVANQNTGSAAITIQASASYESPSGQNIPQLFYTASNSTTYSKIRSVRYGATGSTAFTVGDLHNLALWDTGLGGNVGTVDKGNTSPSGDSVTITWSGDAYHYIVYNGSLSYLSNIQSSGFGVLSQFQSSSVGDWKVYRTKDLQAGGGGSSIDYDLTL